MTTTLNEEARKSLNVARAPHFLTARVYLFRYKKSSHNILICTTGLSFCNLCAEGGCGCGPRRKPSVGGGLDSTLKSTALFPVRSRPDLKSKIMNHKLRDKTKR